MNRNDLIVIEVRGVDEEKRLSDFIYGETGKRVSFGSFSKYENGMMLVGVHVGHYEEVEPLNITVAVNAGYRFHSVNEFILTFGAK